MFLVIVSLIFYKLIGIKNRNLNCIETTKKFLTWYKNNDAEISSGKYRYITTNSNGYYEIDFEAEKRYLAYLKTSGYFSDEFLKNLDTYFVKGNRYFKEQKLTDDSVPEGFNFDLIFDSQEVAYIFEKLPNMLKITTVNGDGKNIMIDNNFNFIFNNQCKIVSNKFI